MTDENRRTIDILALVPGGILPGDHWHIGTNDDTCSRCRQPLPMDDVPLRIWRNDGEDMLVYCERCLKGGDS